MPIGQTPRGFNDYAHLKDSYGADVTVRESSAAMRPNVWIFVEGGGTGSEANPNKGATHLTVAQAKIIRDALNEWIEEVPERWQCVCDNIAEYGECPVHPETWEG